MAGIEDDVAALDFDLACTLRLQIYDNQKEVDRFKILAHLLGTGGMEEPEAGDIPEAP